MGCDADAAFKQLLPERRVVRTRSVVAPFWKKNAMAGLKRIVFAVACLVLVPAAAYAQASIAGVVRDASGAVLPGVTVEAASPALIEKVRSVVTDGSGQYQGRRSPPWHLQRDVHAARIQHGQTRRHRAGGSFTATVNADLRVGAVEETITVTGNRRSSTSRA